jgi:tetratricopeptide (TPR) repeat protein
MLDEAMEEFKKAIGMNPDYAVAHNNLGLAYAGKSLIDEAIEALQRLITTLASPI